MEKTNIPPSVRHLYTLSKTQSNSLKYTNTSQLMHKSMGILDSLLVFSCSSNIDSIFDT